MGNLISRITDCQRQMKTMFDVFEGAPPKVLILGLDGAGKTTFLYSAKLDDFIYAIAPPRGVIIEHITPRRGATLQLLDLPGSKLQRHLWHNWFQNAEDYPHKSPVIVCAVGCVLDVDRTLYVVSFIPHHASARLDWAEVRDILRETNVDVLPFRARCFDLSSKEHMIGHFGGGVGKTCIIFVADSADEVRIVKATFELDDMKLLEPDCIVIGIVFVVDSADKVRIDEAKFELHDLLTSNWLRKAPLVVVANKQDLPESMTEQEVANELDLHSIKNRDWSIFGVSSKKQKGVKFVFEDMVDKLKAFRHYRSSLKEQQKIDKQTKVKDTEIEVKTKGAPEFTSIEDVDAMKETKIPSLFENIKKSADTEKDVKDDDGDSGSSTKESVTYDQMTLNKDTSEHTDTDKPDSISDSGSTKAEVLECKFADTGIESGEYLENNESDERKSTESSISETNSTIASESEDNVSSQEEVVEKVQDGATNENISRNDQNIFDENRDNSENLTDAEENAEIDTQETVVSKIADKSTPTKIEGVTTKKQEDTEQDIPKKVHEQTSNKTEMVTDLDASTDDDAEKDTQ